MVIVPSCAGLHRDSSIPTIAVDKWDCGILGSVNQERPSIQLLGTLVLRNADGREFTLGTRKARALLAILAVESDRWHSRDRLAGLLWGRHPQAQARNSLSQALYEIRKAENGLRIALVERGTERLRLASSDVRCDLHELEALLESNPVAAADLHDHELLADLQLPEPGFSDWLATTRTHWQSRIAEALRSRAEVKSDQRGFDGALAAAHRLVVLEPLDERARRILMRLLVQDGNRAEALRQYRVFEDGLRDELRIAPDEETQKLYQSIREREVAESTVDDDFGGRPQSAHHAETQDAPSLGASLAILPFEYKGSDSNGEFLADGLTEDITTAMSAVRWLMVIARASAIATAERTRDIQQVGSELKVDYVVTGSVRKSRDRIRVTADLIDVRSRNQIWSKRYDRGVEDIFDVQDDLARNVASELGPEITKAGLDHMSRNPPQGLNAWEAYQRGLAAMFQRSQESLEQARCYFEAAIEHDPRFASPYASLGLVHWRQILWRMIPPEEIADGVDTMFTLAAKALMLDPRESVALVVRGLAYLLRSQFALSLREMDSALNANPSSALALTMRGSVHTCSHGDNEQAVRDLQTAERLSPTDPLSRSQRLSALAYATYQLGKFQESARYGEEAFRYGARYGAAYGIAACIAGGDQQEARRRVADLRAQDPDLTIRFLQSATAFIPKDDVSKRFYQALEQAGLPIE